mmetsp:Transcript_19136/g.58015  ORF Transcript_19136/g.58015 Transcript_19136/m.58015 type:complete len:206 (-) Transcript_19136:1876-2493(-)
MRMSRASAWSCGNARSSKRFAQSSTSPASSDSSLHHSASRASASTVRRQGSCAMAGSGGASAALARSSRSGCTSPPNRLVSAFMNPSSCNKSSNVAWAACSSCLLERASSPKPSPRSDSPARRFLLAGGAGITTAVASSSNRTPFRERPFSAILSSFFSAAFTCSETDTPWTDPKFWRGEFPSKLQTSFGASQQRRGGSAKASVL